MNKKLELAEREHSRFVDLMYSYFDIEKPPKYCSIELRPLLVDSTFSPPLWIYLSEELSEKMIAPVTWHESGHFLHESRLKKKGWVQTISNNRYREFIADLSLLVYLALSEGISVSSLEKYDLAKVCHQGKTNGDLNKALNIAKDRRDLLQILATSRPKRAMALARKYGYYDNPFHI